MPSQSQFGYRDVLRIWSVEYFELRLIKEIITFRLFSDDIGNWILKTPIESYPLFVAVAFGLSSNGVDGFYMMYKKLVHDESLSRLRPVRNEDERLKDLIEQAESSINKPHKEGESVFAAVS
ncbi:hypothetical protein HDU97_009339 [Phlyctochytrium planicorne]|nr:hypothetical protein HDU97_009339 [Phlyctochytrium planicorne]